MPEYATARRPVVGYAPGGTDQSLARVRPERAATAEAGIAAEVHRVRLEAQARYTEVDLLVATLRDHIRDLRHERDVLRAQLERTREVTHLASTPWLPRGMKPPR